MRDESRFGSTLALRVLVEHWSNFSVTMPNRMSVKCRFLWRKAASAFVVPGYSYAGIALANNILLLFFFGGSHILWLLSTSETSPRKSLQSLSARLYGIFGFTVVFFEIRAGGVFLRKTPFSRCCFGLHQIRKCHSDKCLLFSYS